MVHKSFLAFDLGAESGRGVLAEYDGAKIALTETGRFPTTEKSKVPGADGIWRWSYDRIVGELAAILERSEHDVGLAGVAVDTWGVDFGLLGSHNELLEHPVCYRDDGNARGMAQVLSVISPEELWDQTGIQRMQFNTLFQIMAANQRSPDLLKRATKLLFMPDLLASALATSPVAASELSIASTSQMLDPRTRQWNTALLTHLGLPSHFLEPIVEPGSSYGRTPGGTPIWATAGHDTASAIAAIPAVPGTTWAYISSGTWSLAGVERPAPELSRKAQLLGLSNEIGVQAKTRLLKNIMGLWLVQECRRSLARDGRDFGYDELTALAAAAPANGPLVDASDSRFLAPADMPAEIAAACGELGQSAPDGPGALIRCCLESLALAYRRTLNDLQDLLAVRFDALHIVGGGTKNKLLNQLASDACGIAVVAGPAEATALGNVLGQLVGCGELAGWEDARTVSRNSFKPDIYEPDRSHHEAWLDREAQFIASTAR